MKRIQKNHALYDDDEDHNEAQPSSVFVAPNVDLPPDDSRNEEAAGTFPEFDNNDREDMLRDDREPKDEYEGTGYRGDAIDREQAIYERIKRLGEGGQVTGGTVDREHEQDAWDVVRGDRVAEAGQRHAAAARNQSKQNGALDKLRQNHALDDAANALSDDEGGGDGDGDGDGGSGGDGEDDAYEEAMRKHVEAYDASRTEATAEDWEAAKRRVDAASASINTVEWAEKHAKREAEKYATWKRSEWEKDEQNRRWGEEISELERELKACGRSSGHRGDQQVALRAIQHDIFELRKARENLKALRAAPRMNWEAKEAAREARKVELLWKYDKCEQALRNPQLADRERRALELQRYGFTLEWKRIHAPPTPPDDVRFEYMRKAEAEERLRANYDTDAKHKRATEAETEKQRQRRIDADRVAKEKAKAAKAKAEFEENMVKNRPKGKQYKQDRRAQGKGGGGVFDPAIFHSEEEEEEEETKQKPSGSTVAPAEADPAIWEEAGDIAGSGEVVCDSDQEYELDDDALNAIDWKGVKVPEHTNKKKKKQASEKIEIQLARKAEYERLRTIASRERAHDRKVFACASSALREEIYEKIQKEEAVRDDKIREIDAEGMRSGKTGRRNVAGEDATEWEQDVTRACATCASNISVLKKQLDKGEARDEAMAMLKGVVELGYVSARYVIATHCAEQEVEKTEYPDYVRFCTLETQKWERAESIRVAEERELRNVDLLDRVDRDAISEKGTARRLVMIGKYKKKTRLREWGKFYFALPGERFPLLPSPARKQQEDEKRTEPFSLTVKEVEVRTDAEIRHVLHLPRGECAKLCAEYGFDYVLVVAAKAYGKKVADAMYPLLGQDDDTSERHMRYMEHTYERQAREKEYMEATPEVRGELDAKDAKMYNEANQEERDALRAKHNLRGICDWRVPFVLGAMHGSEEVLKLGSKLVDQTDSAGITVLSPGAFRDERERLMEFNVKGFWLDTHARGVSVPEVFVREGPLDWFFEHDLPALARYKTHLPASQGILIVNPPWRMDHMKYEPGPEDVYIEADYINDMVLRRWRTSGGCQLMVCIRLRYPWSWVSKFFVGPDGFLPEYEWVHSQQATAFRTKEAMERLANPDLDFCAHGTYYYHVMARKDMGIPTDAPHLRKAVIWRPSQAHHEIYLPNAVFPNAC